MVCVHEALVEHLLNELMIELAWSGQALGLQGLSLLILGLLLFVLFLLLLLLELFLQLLSLLEVAVVVLSVRFSEVFLCDLFLGLA